MNKLTCIFLLLLITACKQHKPAEIPTRKSNIQIFVDSTFNTEAYELLNDSLKVQSLNATLFSVHEMVSHGTDYTIIRDDSTKQYFILPKSRASMLNLLPLDDLYELLDTTGLLKAIGGKLDGIEHFLSQSPIFTKTIFTYEQLDTILQYQKTYWLGERINTLEELDSAYTKVFPGKKKLTSKKERQIRYITSVVRKKMQDKTALVYFASGDYLNVYEINPGGRWTNYPFRQFLKAFPIYNIRYTEVGLNYYDREIE